jgi:short-subunit dehydrogenase
MERMSVTERSAIITGASSGIGWALAKELARGEYKVGLLARRTGELEKLAAEIRAAGGIAEFETADVADRSATHTAIHRLAQRLGPIELLVANAGIGGESHVDPMNVEHDKRIFEVNVFGMMHAFEAVLPEMLKRKQGHLAAVSSLAAYKGFPGQQGYCASKAAIWNYLEGLRIQLRYRGIAVTTICPGFVRTPLTDKHDFKMPFLMDADNAARRVARALRRKQKVHNFPLLTERMVKFLYWVPDRIMAWALRNTYS